MKTVKHNIQGGQQDGQVEALRREIDEWKTKYLRALADYQNLEKRTELQLEEGRKYAAQTVLARFLPIVDTLEQAQKHIKDAGLELALKELTIAMSESGLRRFQTVGTKFDPNIMECVEVEEDECEIDNTVIEEISPGYTLYGKIIRTAKVKVRKQKQIKVNS